MKHIHGDNYPESVPHKTLRSRGGSHRPPEAAVSRFWRRLRTYRGQSCEPGGGIGSSLSTYPGRSSPKLVEALKVHNDSPSVGLKSQQLQHHSPSQLPMGDTFSTGCGEATIPRTRLCRYITRQALGGRNPARGSALLLPMLQATGIPTCYRCTVSEHSSSSCQPSMDTAHDISTFEMGMAKAKHRVNIILDRCLGSETSRDFCYRCRLTINLTRHADSCRSS